MSSTDSERDVERAFAALSTDAERGLLLSGPELRRQAGRRHNRGIALTTGAVAVLVVGAIGTGWALAGNGQDDTAPIAAASSGISPTSSPVPTTTPPSSAPSSAPATTVPPTTPATTPPTSAGPAIPKSIPARALLSKADVRGEATRSDEPRGVPAFCAKAKFPSEKQVGVSASELTVFRGPDTPAENVPDDTVYHTVTVFRSDGAQNYLSELRQAVQSCPTGKIGDLEAQFDSLGSLGLGDESILIDRSYASRGGDGEPMNNGSRTSLFLAVVRVGDSVTVLDSTGYENFGASRSQIEALARMATDRLKDWRS